MYFSYSYLSPPGEMLLISDGEALTGLYFIGQRHFPGTEGCEMAELEIFCRTCKWLDGYFAGKIPGAIPKIRPAGSEFQMKIWNELLKIPYGSTVTYGELARTVAGLSGRERMSAQAVGNAVSRNPISVIIPCHRVLGADGSLTGYAGGVERKRALLTLEADTIRRNCRN